jgi:hypothetical protein
MNDLGSGFLVFGFGFVLIFFYPSTKQTGKKQKPITNYQKPKPKPKTQNQKPNL